MTTQYTIDTVIRYTEQEQTIQGVVIYNFESSLGDICICWENGIVSKYDKQWLDENVIIV